MPFAAALSALTLFLILAYLLPAVTIFAVLILLFPGIASYADTESALLAAGAVLVIAYIHGSPCQLIEFWCLDRLWSKMRSKYRIKDRAGLVKERSHIISEAEAYSIDHSHFDQTLGEYILFLNTGLWLIGLALVRIIGSPWWGLGFEFSIAWAILLASSISVFYVSPLWKSRYLDILEVLKSAIDFKKEHPTALKS